MRQPKANGSCACHFPPSHRKPFRPKEIEVPTNFFEVPAPCQNSERALPKIWKIVSIVNKNSSICQI